MALTPADVHNQQFTTVRMRTGYEMDEVDAFLDVVEAEIGRLLAENDDLRAQVTQAQSRALAAEQRAAGAKEDRAAGAKEDRAAGAKEDRAAGAKVSAVESVGDEVVGEVVDEVVGEVAGEVVGDGVAEVVVEAAPEVATEVAVPADIAADVEVVDQIPASDQALKILQIAQRTADETVAHARSEAADIMTKARSKAAEVTANLDAQRIALEKQVGQLRTFERNYRVALRDHIAGQLAEFDRAASKEESVAEPTPAIESVQAVLEESPGA